MSSREKKNAYWKFLEGSLEEMGFELGSGTHGTLPGRVRAGKIMFQEMSTACFRLLIQERQGEFGRWCTVWRDCSDG